MELNVLPASVRCTMYSVYCMYSALPARQTRLVVHTLTPDQGNVVPHIRKALVQQSEMVLPHIRMLYQAMWCHHTSKLHPSMFVQFPLFHPAEGSHNTKDENLLVRVSRSQSLPAWFHQTFSVIKCGGLHTQGMLCYAMQVLEQELIHHWTHFGPQAPLKSVTPLSVLCTSYLYAPRLLLNGDKVLHLCSALVQQFHALIPP